MSAGDGVRSAAAEVLTIASVVGGEGHFTRDEAIDAANRLARRAMDAEGRIEALARAAAPLTRRGRWRAVTPSASGLTFWSVQTEDCKNVLLSDWAWTDADHRENVEALASLLNMLGGGA